MTNRTATKTRRHPVTSPAPSRFPVFGVVVAAVAVALLVGIAIAANRSGSTHDGSGDAASFGTVSVTGDPLPTLEDGDTDAAIGMAAPTLTMQDPDGSKVVVGPGQATVLAFVAHWCPHCQAEVPRLVDLASSGTFAGVRLVAVATGTNPQAPNFPPAAWLEREDWPGEVLLDDQASHAAAAFGLSGYPYLVAIDADGQVVARTSGELSTEQVESLAAAARGETR